MATEDTNHYRQKLNQIRLLLIATFAWPLIWIPTTLATAFLVGEKTALVVFFAMGVWDGVLAFALIFQQCPRCKKSYCAIPGSLGLLRFPTIRCLNCGLPLTSVELSN